MKNIKFLWILFFDNVLVYFLTLLTCVGYYFYRLFNAIFLINKPIMTFRFWCNEDKLVRRSVLLSITLITCYTTNFIFGFKTSIIIALSIFVLNIVVFLMMVLIKFFKKLKHGREKE